MTTVIPDSKICAVCSLLLPSSEFKRHSSSADGLQNKCIPCGTSYKRSKKCAECGLSKALAAYPVNRLRPDGRGSWCTDCHDRAADDVARRLAQRRRAQTWVALNEPGRA